MDPYARVGGEADQGIMTAIKATPDQLRRLRSNASGRPAKTKPVNPLHALAITRVSCPCGWSGQYQDLAARGPEAVLQCPKCGKAAA